MTIAVDLGRKAKKQTNKNICWHFNIYEHDKFHAHMGKV